jgi:hypothetical protein
LPTRRILLPSSVRAQPCSMGRPLCSPVRATFSILLREKRRGHHGEELELLWAICLLKPGVDRGPLRARLKRSRAFAGRQRRQSQQLRHRRGSRTPRAPQAEHQRAYRRERVTVDGPQIDGPDRGPGRRHRAMVCRPALRPLFVGPIRRCNPCSGACATRTYAAPRAAARACGQAPTATCIRASGGDGDTNGAIVS